MRSTATFAVVGLGDEDEARILGEEPCQLAAGGRLVVHDENPRGTRAAHGAAAGGSVSSGTQIRTRRPPSSLLSNVRR